MIQFTSGNTQPKLPLVPGVKCTANLRIPLLFMMEASSSGSTKFHEAQALMPPPQTCGQT
ncbi:hypothetical protein [Akkermansia sp.]|uniref:hypothetical protein n=1 Tax=Akkermansia sp. TaxID=1872421 RepID=UPI0025B8F932|nr:hypothetical protein [Akkermansia sp.]